MLDLLLLLLDWRIMLIGSGYVKLQVDLLLVETSLPLNDFSCILYAKNWSSSLTRIFMAGIRCFILIDIQIINFSMKVCVSLSELGNLHMSISFIVECLCNRRFWFTAHVAIWALERISFLLLVWRCWRFSNFILFISFLVDSTLALIYTIRTINSLLRNNLECFNLFILFNGRRSLCLNWSLCKSKSLRFYQSDNLAPGNFHFLRRICFSSFKFLSCALFFAFCCLLERSIHKLNLLADLYWTMSESSHAQLFLVRWRSYALFVRWHNFFWLCTSSRPFDACPPLNLCLTSFCVQSKTCSRI